MQQTHSPYVVGLLLMLAGGTADPRAFSPPHASGKWDVRFIFQGLTVDRTEMDVDEQRDGSLRISIILDGKAYALSGTITPDGEVISTLEVQPGYVVMITGSFNAARTDFHGDYTTNYDHVVQSISLRAARQ